MITLKQMEGTPASYPTVTGLSTEAAALNLDALWKRIETHVVHRWSERSVVWTIEGPGEWVPPLTPVIIGDSYCWDGSAWVVYSLVSSPLGYELPYGKFKVEATVGSDALPEDGAEALRRLAEYLATAEDERIPIGASQYNLDLGSIREEIHRPQSFVARALVNSGAADLLRSYRRI